MPTASTSRRLPTRYASWVDERKGVQRLESDQNGNSIRDSKRLVTERALDGFELRSDDPKDPDSLGMRVRVMNYVGSE